MSSRHNRDSATNARRFHNFRGGDYVAALMEELSRAAIHERIKAAREAAGLDQNELADLLDVSHRAVQSWESKTPPMRKDGKRGKLVVPFDRLREIAEALNTTHRWIMYGLGPSEPDDSVLAELRGQVSTALERLERLQEAVDRIDQRFAQDG